MTFRVGERVECIRRMSLRFARMSDHWGCPGQGSAHRSGGVNVVWGFDPKPWRWMNVLESWFG